MREIETLSQFEIDQIVGSKPVLFIGSAISTFYPTNLASGAEFCNQLFQYIFERGNFDIRIPPAIKSEIINIPFEAIMECFPVKVILPRVLNSIYGTDVWNSFHYCFARLLSQDRIASIITPNYDLAIDAALHELEFSNIIRNYQDYTSYLQTVDTRAYFKIHGTSEARYEDTLIYTLSQEGTLSQWKKDLLEKLLPKKTIILIGYSGRDFDICPLIAEIEYKNIIWIKYKDNDNRWKEQTAYEEYLLNKKLSNETILGDFESVLKLFGEGAHASKGDITLDFEKIFGLSSEEIYKWRLNILDRIACASIGMLVISKVAEKLEFSYICKLESDMMGHQGKYSQAALKAVSLSNQFPPNSRENIIGLNMASRFWLYYGKFLTAYRYLNRIKKIKRSYYNDDDSLESAILENEITFMQRIKQLISNRLLMKLLKRVHKCLDGRIDKLEIKMVPLKESGNWDERQMIQHNLERLGRDKQVELALPAFKGYKNLGLPGMAIIKCRHKLSGDVWGAEAIKLLDDCIAKAKILGMYTELWKLYRLKFKRANLTKNQKKIIWFRWKALSKITEYAFPFQINVQLDLYYHYYFKM